MPRGCYRNVCFTKFNGVPPFIPEKMVFMVYQFEVCPTTKRDHVQGYVEFKGQHSLKCAAGLLQMPLTDAIQPRYGTQKQAIEYCTKEDLPLRPGRKPGTEPVIHGAATKQGNRSDLDSIWDGIESGLNTKEILFTFRGHALRHIHMISAGLRVMHNMDAVDRRINTMRMQQELLERRSQDFPPPVQDWTQPIRESSQVGSDIFDPDPIYDRRSEQSIPEHPVFNDRVDPRAEGFVYYPDDPANAGPDD